MTTHTRLLALAMSLVGTLALATSQIRSRTPAERASAPILFENTISRSGISFVLDNGATPHKYQEETMAGGVAVFDYNNDGLLDLFFTNGAHLPDMDKSNTMYFNRLYRNNGDGTFTDVTLQAGLQGSRYSIGAAAADYDNDGFEDLFITGANGYQLFHNNHDGTFTDVTAKAELLRSHPAFSTAFSVSAGWFDYDNDGYLDLMVINYLAASPSTEPLCTSKGIHAYCSPDSYSGLPNLLFHNNGDGTFTDVSESSGVMAHVGKGMGVAFNDYDNDGFVDIFVSNDTYRNFLFHNNGNGTFSEVGIISGVAYPDNGKSVAGMGVDFRDIDNDGLPDIFETAMHGDTFPYFHNIGKGLFDYSTSPSHIAMATSRLTGWGTGIFDFDNDGWKDIFTSNAAILDNSEAIDQLPYKQSNSILRNNHDGTFAEVGALAGRSFNVPAAHRGAAFGDLDNDGRIDIVTNCLNGSPEILINRTANHNHWLIVNLVGSRSNRDGLGTQLKLTTPQSVQYNVATTSLSYGSSSDKRVHFGLGTAETVETLELKWPSGIRQTLTNIKGDRILTVSEPAR